MSYTSVYFCVSSGCITKVYTKGSKCNICACKPLTRHMIVSRLRPFKKNSSKVTTQHTHTCTNYMCDLPSVIAGIRCTYCSNKSLIKYKCKWCIMSTSNKSKICESCVVEECAHTLCHNIVDKSGDGKKCTLHYYGKKCANESCTTWLINKEQCKICIKMSWTRRYD
jgi:hypothetical protein